MLDNDAKDDLILQHQDYVCALARGIARKLPSHVDVEELIGFGQVGLAEAAQRYDFRSGASFETFAYRRIRGAIFDGLGKMTWLPPAARNAVKFEEGVDAISENAEAAANSNDPEQLAEQFRRSLRSLGAVFLMSHQDEEEDSLEPVDHESAAESAERKELVEKVRRVIDELDDKQAAIIRMHYFENRSLTDCAAVLGHNKAWVSRLHARALDALHPLLDATSADP